MPVVKIRHYYIDWLRICAVNLVIYVHTIAVCDEIRKFHKPDSEFEQGDQESRDTLTEMDERRDGAWRSLLQYGIPLFFYISGFSVTLFNTEKHGFKKYLFDKTKRLLVPLVIAILLFLVPTMYARQDYTTAGRYDESFPDYNFFSFYVQFLVRGNFIK